VYRRAPEPTRYRWCDWPGDLRLRRLLLHAAGLRWQSTAVNLTRSAAHQSRPERPGAGAEFAGELIEMRYFGGMTAEKIAKGNFLRCC
jgi:hypothetical protein